MSCKDDCEWWVDEHSNGGDRGLFKFTFAALERRVWGNLRIFIHDRRIQDEIFTATLTCLMLACGSNLNRCWEFHCFRQSLPENYRILLQRSGSFTSLRTVHSNHRIIIMLYVLIDCSGRTDQLSQWQLQMSPPSSRLVKW